MAIEVGQSLATTVLPGYASRCFRPFYLLKSLSAHATHARLAATVPYKRNACLDGTHMRTVCFSSGCRRAACYYYTVKDLRPRARLFANTRRPFFVDMRERKPCTFMRWRFLGWYVRNKKTSPLNAQNNTSQQCRYTYGQRD